MDAEILKVIRQRAEEHNKVVAYSTEPDQWTSISAQLSIDVLGLLREIESLQKRLQCQYCCGHNVFITDYRCQDCGEWSSENRYRDKCDE